MSKQAFIFDIDGVINIVEKFSSRIERDHGIPTSKILPFFHGVFQQCLVGRADLKEEIPKYMLEWGWPGSLDDLLDYWFSGEDNLDPRMMALIKKLRRNEFPVWLTTDNEKYRSEYLRDKMGLGKLVDNFFSSAFIGCRKNDVKFYQKIFTEIGKIYLPNKNIIIFWDDEEDNVRAARQFGFNANLFTSFAEFKKINDGKIKK